MSKNPTRKPTKEAPKLEIILKNKKKVGLSCVYFLIKDSEVVYVGQSGNGGFDRIGAHLKYSDKVFDSYYIHRCDAEDINEVEAECILILSPTLNKVLPHNKKYQSITSISKKYKKWNIPKFITDIIANGIPIHSGKYIEISRVDSVFGVKQSLSTEGVK